MNGTNRKIPLLLGLGDILSLSCALIVTLLIRYGFDISSRVFFAHIEAFSFVVLFSILVYLTVGLYEQRSSIFRSGLWPILLRAQIANALFAIMFFYFIPFFSIAPKTNLFIYIVISTILITLWRLYGTALLRGSKKETAMLLATGTDAEELRKELRSGRHSVSLVETMNEKVSLVIADFHNEEVRENVSKLYDLLFKSVRFVDITKVYENVFGRVPLSIINENWFIENISTGSKQTYEILKRGMDIIVASVLILISLPLYPLIMLAIVLSSKGPVCIFQKRIGKDNKVIIIPKFRTMTVNDGGVWVTENDTRITRVGKFLRATRIDELPQLFSVLKGDMSLIGPRPDIYDLGMKLEQEIPYYAIRNVIKPGLSGWAQIEQYAPPQSIEETKMRLAYDFYYIKNRSLVLDIKIALRTIKTLLSRAGR